LKTTLEDQKLQFEIRRGPFDNRKRKLTIHSDFIEFENKDLIADLYTRFEKNEIIAFRYGIRWIEVYHFTIGREYQIYLKDTTDKILKISFKSLFGLKKTVHHHLYTDILNGLWSAYFLARLNDYIDRFNKKENINICGVDLSYDGIVIQTDKLFDSQKVTIEWNMVGYKEYRTHFVIYHTENKQINRGYNFLMEWNTEILYRLVEAISQAFQQPKQSADDLIN
jgi:hypothetical protein